MPVIQKGTSVLKAPRKAILLAAGFGTRMRPLSYDLPKALMPLWGKPLVGHLITMMIRWGVREVLVNLHHRADDMMRYLRSQTGGGVRINMSFEPEILGTGGALRKAEWFVGNDPFWVANTDIAADVQAEPFVESFRRTDPVAVLWLDPRKGPRTVEAAGGRIISFRGGTAGCRGGFTFCGLQLVAPELMGYLPPTGFSGVITAYEKAMSAGRTVAGVVVQDSFWSDLGTPDTYIETHAAVMHSWKNREPGACLFNPASLRKNRELTRRKVVVHGFASIADTAIVEPGSRLENSVLWDGAWIKSGSRLTGAIAARDVKIGGSADGVVVRADVLTDVKTVARALDRLGWSRGRVAAQLMPERGSDRAFTLLFNERKRAVLMKYGTARPENARYAGHAVFLRQLGVAVPSILADIPTDRIMVMEYLGSASLEAMAPSLSRTGLLNCYRRVLDCALRLHIPVSSRSQRDLPDMEPPFCSRMYKWERGLMERYYLTERLKLKPAVIKQVMEDLRKVSSALLNQPRVLVHRDFQSSNVLWHGGKPYLIDFQGMRAGPAVYDIASLLCDPYVMLDEDAQIELLDYYRNRCSHSRITEDSFWYGAVERLAQALGAFGRLADQPATARFAAYIDPAVVMMHRALSHLKGLDRIKEVVAGELPPAFSSGRPQ